MDKKIRIAVMTHTIDGRQMGTALVARKCVEALLARRDEFDLTFVHYEKWDDPIYHHGVREVILPEFRPRFFNRRSLRQTYYFLTTKDRFDIFHWFQPRLYPFFWLAPAKKLVVTVHSVDAARAEHFNLMREVFLRILQLFRKKIAAAIATSAYARDQIIRVYGFKPEQVIVINTGVEKTFSPAGSDAIAAVKKKYDLPETFFLNVARLIPSKNAFRTMRAFERFAYANPKSTIHFVNVGASGTEREAVDAFLAKSPFKDRIRLVKYVEDADLAAVYSAAFALVFPMLNDGLGLPAIEAMASGTPTIISETAFPEITRDEALLVDATSEEEIARAMQEMLDNASLRRQFIQNGLVCGARFTWEAAQHKLITMYRELMRDAK